MKKTWLLGLASVLLAAGVSAQAPEVTDEDERAPEPVHKIRVLENPYDIASFYRSSQGSGGGDYFSYQPSYDFSERYPIAGYYRQRQSGRGFGVAGYYSGAPRRSRMLIGYRRSLGRNADLFLIAPTFLAPVGPLSAAFFDGR